MELTYTKCGDYYIPNLVLSDTKELHNDLKEEIVTHEVGQALAPGWLGFSTTNRITATRNGTHSATVSVMAMLG